MTYKARMRLALAVSLGLHFLLLAMSGFDWPLGGDAHLSVPDPPLVINLQPSQPEQRRQVVASVAPPQKPRLDTPLIAENDSRASDTTAHEGGKAIAPKADEASEFFEMGGPAMPAPPAPSRPPAPPPTKPNQLAKTNEAKKHRDESDKNAKKAPSATKPKTEEPQKSLTDVARLEPLESLDLGVKTAPDDAPAQGALSEPGAKSDSDRVETANLAPAPPPSLRGGRFRGSVEGDVAEGKGFQSFEAMKSEIAPYMLEIRRRVERHWQAAMTLKYTGTTPTKATVDCAISPEGRLLSVTIVDPGGSTTFAPICKDSIEKAGPFPPFPFKVPDIYRNKNLEIHWTFHFM